MSDLSALIAIALGFASAAIKKAMDAAKSSAQ
jgi:hypothetical protein